MHRAVRSAARTSGGGCAHDAVLPEFADDGVFETVAGPEPCGERFAGKHAIRAALERAFKGPDFTIEDTIRWLVGDRVVSEFTFVKMSPSGQRTEMRGCDLFTLRDGNVLRKDTYLKQRRSPGDHRHLSSGRG